MSNSKATADKIIAHLEVRHHQGHGFNRIFGSMKRKEINEVRDAIADIVDGKDVAAPELKPLPVAKQATDAKAKPATPPAKPKAAQA